MTSPDCSSGQPGSALRVARCSAALRRLRNASSAGRRAVVAALALALARSSRNPASAITPFVVKDIRVEGVQRTEAGTVFSYLPIKVGDTLDDEKAALAVKALFATGFFRDVQARSGGRRAPRRRPGAADDQQGRDLRQQGIRHRHAEEGAEGDRRRRRAHLRPLRARPRRAGNEAPVPVARPVRGEGHGDGHAAGAQPGRHQHRDRGGRRVEDRADQHRRRERLQRERAARA